MAGFGLTDVGEAGVGAVFVLLVMRRLQGWVVESLQSPHWGRGQQGILYLNLCLRGCV
jgi:hypothetical protein